MFTPVNFRYCLVLLLIHSTIILSYTQDCLEYAPIEGGECVGCVPSGWDIDGITSPDIIPSDGTWPGGGCMIDELSGESPGGGNMVMFVGIQSSGYAEAMSTTVSGLNPGQQYGFGLYWEMIAVNNCGTWVGGDLLVELDGEEYEFSGAEDWEFIEICFFPSSESIDINLSIINEGSVDNYAIVVDSPECDQITPCCPLVTGIDEESTVICPGEEYVIPAFYAEEEGSVIVEWTSDPSDGVSYLDDPTDITPTFLVSNIEDFEGETYLFTLRVEDDNCESFQEFELEVLPSIVPEFEFYLCEVYEIPPFPTESLDGYTGVWDGNFNFEDLGGTVQEYTFILDPGQDNCIEEWVYEVPIDEAVDLTFEIQTEYCVIDEERYRLPDESEERVEGEWVEDRIVPSQLGEGVFIFTFNPENEEFCAFPFELEIEVFPADSLSFNLNDTYCATGDTLFLPITSNENIFGSWNEDFIVLNTADTYELEFIPEEINDCYYPFEIEITINSSSEASFDLERNICSENEFFEPNPISLEGYDGIWDPVRVDFDTLSLDSFQMSWSPTNSFNGCLRDTSLTFYIYSPENVSFDLPDTLCVFTGNYNLPLISSNGLAGTWNISSFNTEALSDSTILLDFVSDDIACPAFYSDEIYIQPSDTPEFSLATTLCLNDPSIDLPLVSDNGIPGNWSVAAIDPSQIIDSLIVQFIPTVDVCADAVSYSFIVEDLIDPTFDLPERLCVTESIYDFSNTSLNGVTGNWTSPEFDPASFQNDVIFNNTFMPDDQECYNTIDVSIPIINFSEINFVSNQVQDCLQPDGLIDFSVGNNQDFEYSIDNGTSWTDGVFNNLTGGNYTILIRSINYIACIESIDIEIENPESSAINDLLITDPNLCSNDNGSVNIIADGNNLEFSIDDGNNWQQDSIFNNLTPGVYTIIVRSDGQNSCSDRQTFSIDSFEVTALLMVDLVPLSDCGTSDASLSITAEGTSLEYSIDNGQNWQSEALFEDLSSGNYQVVVRSSIDPDCSESVEIVIEELINPEITDVLVSDISDCDITDGIIEIRSDNTQSLEYSIDGGVSWQESNLFDNLTEGEYMIQIRLSEFPSCIDMNTATVASPSVPVIDNSVIQPAEDCVSENGSIDIFVSNISDAEFSIDDGNTWQSNGLFNQLPPGDYTVNIRSESSNACTESIEFTIEEPECPCNTLNIEFDFTEPDCLDPLSGAIEVTSIEGLFTGEDYELVWSNGNIGLVNENLSEGWYSYTINYDKNCVLFDSTYLDSTEPISFDLLSFDQDCQGLGSIEVTNLNGGSGVFEFSLDGFNFQESSIFFDLTADEYEVLVQSAFNCDSLANTDISDISDLELALPEIQPINIGDTVVLNPLINETTIDDFEWAPQSGIINPGELIAQVSPTETTEYSLTIYFGDCVETRSIIVQVMPSETLYVPNVFNPSEFGNNSVFYIQSRSDIAVDLMAIYDRWGNLVFELEDFMTNDIESGWDGYRNDGKVEIGAYVYMLQYSINGEEKIESGTITLVR